MTKDEYDKALKQIGFLWDSEKKSKEGKLLDLLIDKVIKYEEENYPKDAPDIIEQIKFRIDQMKINVKKLSKSFDDPDRLDKILNKKVEISKEDAKILSKKLNISESLLTLRYK